MRITAKISSVGGSWMGRFPMLDIDIGSLSNDGRLDEGRVRHCLGQCPEMILIGERDDRGVLAVGLEFLRQIYSVTKYLDGDEKSDCRLNPKTAVDRSLDRRMERDKVAYCRIDISRWHGQVRVRISYSNPKGVMGTAEDSARKFAVYVARILVYMRNELIKGGSGIVLEGIGSAVDVVDEALFEDSRQDEIARISSLNDRRKACVRRLGDFCSPVDLSCACCHGGMCVKPELDVKWETFESYRRAK